MTSPDAPTGRVRPEPARRFVPAALVALAAPLLGASAMAQQSPVDQVNALYATIGESQRSDLVLFPVLAGIERPPIGAEAIQQAMLMPAGSVNWSRAEAWATGAPQVAVLEALDQVTRGEDWRTAMALGQPYGPGVPRTLIARGMYTELGDPPSLAAASFGYMERLGHMASLVHVEATRRAGGGDPAGAIDVLTDWLFLTRQVADREFGREAEFGYRQMLNALERIRDIAYQDMRGERRLTLEQLQAAITRLEERGLIGIERLTLPRADQIAASQLIARVFDRGGRLNGGAFSSAMASVGSSERPLRVFSEAARFSGAAGSHADRSATEALLNQITADFDARWRLDPFDARLGTPPVFAQVDGNPQFAVIDAAMDDYSEFVALRQQLRTEAVGTRAALGLVGYYYQTRQLPPTLASIRPRWISELEADPYNPDRGRERRPPLEYFVPMRDTQAQGGAAH